MRTRQKAASTEFDVFWRRQRAAAAVAWVRRLGKEEDLLILCQISWNDAYPSRASFACLYSVGKYKIGMCTSEYYSIHVHIRYYIL
jgi:hypothetical protein